MYNYVINNRSKQAFSLFQIASSLVRNPVISLFCFHTDTLSLELITIVHTILSLKNEKSQLLLFTSSLIKTIPLLLTPVRVAGEYSEKCHGFNQAALHHTTISQSKVTRQLILSLPNFHTIHHCQCQELLTTLYNIQQKLLSLTVTLTFGQNCHCQLFTVTVIDSYCLVYILCH